MKITRKHLRRLIYEGLISEQVMWHSTAPENVDAILSQGLQTGRGSANTLAGAWADEFYGTRPVYLSVEKGKYEGTPLAVDTSGLGLVADLPTLVDTGAYQEEEGMYWDEGSEPAQMIDIVDEDGMVYFDELLSPGSAAAQAAIEITGTAAVIDGVPPESISMEERGLKSNEPSAAEPEWASKSQAEKDAHVKNAVWETMAWKRYRRYAQAEGIPFDPDNEEDMKVARAWWKEQPESRQFEGKMRITRKQLRRIIQERGLSDKFMDFAFGEVPDKSKGPRDYRHPKLNAIVDAVNDAKSETEIGFAELKNLLFTLNARFANREVIEVTDYNLRRLIREALGGE